MNPKTQTIFLTMALQDALVLQQVAAWALGELSDPLAVKAITQAMDRISHAIQTHQQLLRE